MRLESKKYLFDALEAGRNIRQFCDGKTLLEYQANTLVRSATERQLEIIGDSAVGVARCNLRRR